MTIKQQGGIFGRNPTFNDVSANTTTTDTLTADASADGSVVTVKRDGSSVGSLGAKSGDFFISSDAMGMRFRDSISAIIPSVDGATGSDDSFDLGNDSNRWRKLYLSDNLVVASGKGIDFSATSGTGTSELFDDYEEGTWNGVFTDQTNNATMLGGYGTGLYTKTGRMVTVTGYFYASSLGSVSGNMYISGLPFANGSLNRNGASVAVGYGTSLSLTAGQVITGIVEPSSSVITLNLWDATSGTTNLQDTEFSSSGGLYISASYMTD